jgi:hypothetical protein
MATAIDTTVSNLAQKAVAATDPVSGSRIAEIVAVIVIALWTWYVKYELSDKENALAKAQTDLENAKMDQQLNLLKSQSNILTDAENLSKKQALDKLTAIAAQQKDLAAAVADHNARVGRVQALKNWEALNFLAGVK